MIVQSILGPRGLAIVADVGFVLACVAFLWGAIKLAYQRTQGQAMPRNLFTKVLDIGVEAFNIVWGTINRAVKLDTGRGLFLPTLPADGSPPSSSAATIDTLSTGNAHANGGTAPKSTANVSLAIWYKPTAATGAVVPLLACTNSDTGPSTGIGIWQNTTIGNVIVTVNGLSNTLAVPSELANQDNLLVLTYDQANAGNELTLYVNGLAVGSIDTTAAAINWFGCTWMIGNDGTALPVSGELCQAAAWDGTTLSSLEVQQIFERGVGTYTGS